MQYLILKYEKRKWIGKMIIKVNSNQKQAFNKLRKKTKKLTGLFWIMPLSHSGFYNYKNGKLIKKKRFYE